MPLFKPPWRPGINRTESSLANEGGFSDGNLVRFWQGKPQPVGGWQLLVPFLSDGVTRGAHEWSNKEGLDVLAFGTDKGLYGVAGGAITDITPPLHERVLDDIFEMESGSATVTVTLAFHGLSSGDEVTFSHHQDGPTQGLTVEGTYTVVSTPTINTFTITHASNASGTSGAPEGGLVDFTAPLPDGREHTDEAGYGAGTYGAGTYSVGASVNGVDARVWSLDNFGENLIANPSGFGLFEWQPETSYNDLSFNGTFTGDADGWALGTGWAYGSNKVSKTAGTGSNLSQSVLDVLEGGRVYRVNFTVADRTAGTVKFRVNAGSTPAVIDVGEASSTIKKNGTYSRLFLCPAEPSDIVFEADSAFNGSIDDVSYQLEDKAYRITTAPWRIDAMFISPQGSVVAVGCSTTDGDYNPICVRNSGSGNVRDWTPDTASVSSENFLRGGGGRLMAGLATREQNIVWGDAGVFSLQYNSSNPLDGNAFTVNLLGTGCGLISRHAMAEHNGFVFWASNSGKFWIFRGVGDTSLGVPEEMPCTVREDVFDNLNVSQAVKCHVGIIADYSEMWFFYPDARDGEIESEITRAVSVAWTAEGLPWATHKLARTAWTNQGVFGSPIGFGIINGDTAIYRHEDGHTANGAKMEWFWETADFDVDAGDNLLRISRFIPDFKDLSGSVTITFTAKNYPTDTNERTFTKTITGTTDFMLLRCLGRSARMKVEGASIGATARSGAGRIDVAATGAKR